MWDLLIEGIIRPGLHDGMNSNLPFFHVTEWGKTAFGVEHPTPYDPDKFFARLVGDVPSIDPVIMIYLEESVRTFRISCLLSSTIALGCASEKSLCLIAAYAASLPQPSRKKFEDNTTGKMIKRQFAELRKMIDGELKVRLDDALADGLDIELDAIFDIIRNQRNDAGHPTGKRIERERAHANLMVFPLYLKKVYALIAWLQANPQS